MPALRHRLAPSLLFCWSVALAAADAQVPKPGARVELEAEACTGSTFQRTIQSPEFSGRKALELNGDTPGEVTYDMVLPSAGTYRLLVREQQRDWGVSSPVRWRMDQGPWQTVAEGIGLPERLLVDGGGKTLSWTEYGEVALEPGRHRLQLQTDPRRRDGKHVLLLDKLVLKTGPFDTRQETRAILRANGSGLLDPDQTKIPAGWFALPIEFDDLKPSLLDGLSPWSGPTSARGRVRREGDHFVFVDGTPIRFWGVSGPATPDKDDAEYYAQRARRLGINLVRLHSLDGELIDRNSPYTGAKAVDPVLLDRLDYFIAKLGEQGIYVLVDCLYDWVNGTLKEADGIPEWNQYQARNRMPWMFDPKLQERNREMLRLLLDRVNPYTGRKNGDDPTVAMLTVVNENGIFFYSADQLPPSITKERQAAWTAWLRDTYQTDQGLAAAWGAGYHAEEHLAGGNIEFFNVWHLSNRANRDAKGFLPENRARVRDQLRFMTEVQEGFFRSVRSFVREDLGFPILVNGSGWKGTGWLDPLDESTQIRDMDYISRHFYWDHPVKGWGLQDGQHHNQSMLAHLDDPAAGSWVQELAGRRPAGIPMTATEWNQCGRNDFLPEAVPIAACYGALHDWSMLLQYRMDTPDWLLQPESAFKTESPAMLYQYPVAAAAFLRGYVQPADLVWREAVPELTDPARMQGQEVDRAMPGPYALVGRCETAYGDAQPVRANIGPFVDAEHQRIMSSTRELLWQGGEAPSLRVAAPKLKGFAGLTDRAVYDLQGVQLRLPPGQRASVFLLSLDGQPLDQSKSMLLTVVGPVSLTGRGPFAKTDTKGKGDEDLYLAKPSGDLPVIMQDIAGTVTFSAPVAAVHALNLSGGRRAEITLEPGGAQFSFQSSQALWYEITRP